MLDKTKSYCNTFGKQASLNNLKTLLKPKPIENYIFDKKKNSQT